MTIGSIRTIRPIALTVFATRGAYDFDVPIIGSFAVQPHVHRRHCLGRRAILR